MKGSGVRVPASALAKCLLFGRVWELAHLSIGRLMEAIWKPHRKAPPPLDGAEALVDLLTV